MTCLVLSSINRTRATRLIDAFVRPAVDQCSDLGVDCKVFPDSLSRGTIPTPLQDRDAMGSSWLWEDGIGDKTLPLVKLAGARLSTLAKSLEDLADIKVQRPSPFVQKG